MKKITTFVFAAVMLLSTVFAGEAISSSGSLEAEGLQVGVRRKSRSVASKTYRGGRYVYRKGANGVRYVYRKTSRGTVYVGKQTYRGGKWTFDKGKRGTKAAVSRTKKILN
jgi:hypothetical protein